MHLFLNCLSRALAAGVTLIMSMAGAAALAQTVTVVEYYNTTLNAYFITGRAAEQATLDTLPDFRRTGMTFQARAASAALPGQQAVCRYAIQVTPTFVSHFYGLTDDCALIARLISEGRITNFTNEGLDFAVEPVRADGTCPAGGFPAYRSLRLGSPVDVPNHRYSVLFDDYLDSQGAGYQREGPVFCIPAGTPVTPRPRFDASPTLRNLCAAPRTGSNPQGVPYPDRQGTIEDEKRWIRSWVDESYLWYREVPNVDLNLFATPQALFPQLKTFARAVSGAPKDRFSFSQSTASVEQTNAGVSFGYGVSWAAIRSAPPREWVASVVTPGSPADQAGVRRGDRIVSIDGVNFVSGGDVNTLNRGLFPPTIGESHVFVLQPASGTATKTVTLTSAQVPIAAVPRSVILNTPTGRVGYIAFTTFNTFTAEKAIADAVQGLVNAGGVSDLVLDLRYNGGGYIYISSQLGYMIAGPARTSGRVFETTKTNDRKPFGPDTVYPFYSVGSGFTGGVAQNQPLPTLNLGRVFILTTGSSCSASESLINGLRGINVETVLIGGTTCGKPYGFVGRDNCGTTYYPIQFTGVNEKGEGDFVEGFAATCQVADDFSRDLGDPAEAQLSAALAYRSAGRCPTGTAAATAKSARTPVDADGALAVGVEQRALGQMKLLSPEAPRGGGLPITPRVPFEIDLTAPRR